MENCQDMTKFIAVMLVTVLFTGDVVWGHTYQDSNTYMDTVINNYLKHDIPVDHLDPVGMPNFNTKDSSIASNYTSGILKGLDSIRRSGNCGTPTWLNSNSTVTCALTFDLLELKYDAKVKYDHMPKVSATASAKIRGTDISIVVTANPSRNVPFLMQFFVRSLGTFTPSYSGLGPLNRFLKKLTPTFSSNASGFVIALLNEQFRRELAQDVGRIVLPMP